MSFNVFPRLKNYFFTRSSNFNIQYTKFIVCLTLLVFATNPPKFFFEDLTSNYQPIGIFKFLPMLDSDQYFGWISSAFRLFLLGAILNFKTRICLIGASIFGLYTLIYRYNFGVVYHGNWLICTALLLLAMVPAHTWKDRYQGIHATWPIRLLQIYICTVYTSAGLQKIMRSGFEWAWSENLAVRIFANKMTPVAEFLMDSDPLLLRLLAMGVLLIELTSFAALISQRLAYLYLVAWTLLHMGIQWTFAHHMDFLMNIATFAAFINWEVWRSKLWLPGFSIDKAKSI